MNHLTPDNSEISIDFIDRYICLKSSRFVYNQYPRINEWDMTKNDIKSHLVNGESGIDFLWKSIIFNLFLKIMYNYSIKNYRYSLDYIRWRVGYKFVNPPIYRGKLKYFVDDKFSSLSEENKKKVYGHTLIKINYYVKFLLYLFDLVKINSENIIYNNIEKIEFRSEFSDNPKDLSYIFFNKLIDLK